MGERSGFHTVLNDYEDERLERGLDFALHRELLNLWEALVFKSGE
jgi:hypothetical protein